MNAAQVVGVFLLAGCLMMLIALSVDARAHFSRGGGRRMRRLRKKATWRDFYEVKANGVCVGVRLAADTRLGEVVIETMTMETVSTGDPMWTSKLRKARLEAWSRADELNSQPPTYAD